MKIHIYTDIQSLFGRACRVWMDVLLAAGHEVEYIDLGTEKEGALPDVGPCDLNLLVTGIYALERFGGQGLPAHGKNILWMLDPLTRNPDAVVHGYKAALFDAIAPQLDAVMAMDPHIENYLRQHYPALAVSRLPYLIAEKDIRPPVQEAERKDDVIFMGHSSPQRLRAEALFEASTVNAEFIKGGLWGTHRDMRLRHCRVALGIHADSEHIYFDQFRTLETWAAGTVMAIQTTPGLQAYGIIPGLHLAMADLADMPALCDQLLREPARREAMVAASQDLLRDRFSVARWQKRMLATIAGVA